MPFSFFRRYILMVYHADVVSGEHIEAGVHVVICDWQLSRKMM